MYRQVDFMAGSNAKPAGPRPGGPGPAERAESPYEMLKNAILHGELGPGQPLVEASLAAWCNVSRTPVREALMRLEQDGLAGRTDRGLVVRERSPEEIIDLYETRMILEATAGRVAAERRTDHDIRTLRRYLSRGEDAGPGDPRAMVAANQQFHRAVWRASHNESLLDLLERLNLHLARYPETTLQYPGRWEQAWKEHAELTGAIAARDSERAHEVALRHFREARDIRLALFDEDPAH
jgi:DNA-binding GntR family transcriptional regulator